MYDVMFVRIRQPECHLRDYIQHLINGQHLPVIHDVAQLPTFQELHRDVCHIATLAHIINGHNIWMIETPCRFGLLIEAPLVFFFFIQGKAKVNRLDRHHAINQWVPSLIDYAHRALT